MGEGILVSYRAFRGHAVENSFFVAGARALCWGGGAWHPFGCTTLSSIWHQSKDRLQMACALSIARRHGAEGSLSMSEALAKSYRWSLGWGNPTTAPATPALGTQKDLCCVAQETSTGPGAQS